MQELQIGPIALSYLSRYPTDAAQVLAGGDTESIAALLDQSMAEIRAEQVAEVLAALPPPMGAECLALLPKETAAEVLPTLSVEAIAEIVSPLAEKTTNRLLSTLRPTKLAGVRRILNYATDSVGKRMRTNAVTLPRGINITKAREMLPTGRTDTQTVVFILDNEHRVRGMVSFQAIAAASGETELESLIQPAPVPLKANQHLGEVRLLPIWQDYRCLPVVGTKGRFIGILDHIDVLQAYANTDASLTNSDGDPIHLLLSIAETVWIPLAYLFGKATYSRHQYHSENREK